MKIISLYRNIVNRDIPCEIKYKLSFPKKKVCKENDPAAAPKNRYRPTAAMELSGDIGVRLGYADHIPDQPTPDSDKCHAINKSLAN